MSSIDSRNRRSAALPPLPAPGEVRCVDRGRLIGMRARLHRADETEAEQVRVRYGDLVQRSMADVARRRSALPQPAFDDSLPIHGEAERLVELIRQHRVVVVAGETGSGKTTQLPKLALLAGQGAAGMIGCTQPRRIAARSVARRVADELGTELGDRVGYQVRFDDRVGESTAIKFMTDGILLAEAQADRWLNAYDTIIVDEAHERSLNIDFLLGLLRRLLDRRDDLKLIITSATIDTARFAAFFGDAPVVEIPGRSYPVERLYRPLQLDGEREPRELTRAIVDTVHEIGRSDGRGDILVFLPGEREIRDCHRALVDARLRHTEILPLYARLSARDQDRVFRAGTGRRIVLATNVAETSLTVPGIRYVIDPGTARISRYSPRSKIQRLEIEPIAQANAEQRAGRCGRIGPGVCYRLYDEADLLARPAFADPEILRSSLANVILRMLALGLGDIEQFAFIDPPSERAVKEGLQQLQELQAITAEHRLTTIGRDMARFPIDVQLARMLVEARRLGPLREILAIVAFLGIVDPRERPHEVRAQADSAHAEFADPRSDFLSVWALWRAWDTAHAELGSSRQRAWCEQRFLNYLRMREWRELHRQLLTVIDRAGWTLPPPVEPLSEGGQELASVSHPPSAATADSHAKARRVPSRRPDAGAAAASPPAAPRQRHDGPATERGEKHAAARQRAWYESVHRAVLAGLPTQVAHRGERGLYDGTRARGFAIFPGSAVAKTQPSWLLSLAVIQTARLYAHVNARIEPEWLYDQAGHLLKRSVFEPHWDRDRGRVIAYEQATLYGLVVHARKRVDYARSDPAGARAIFLLEGLAECAMNSRSEVIAANAQVLAQAREEEAKRRRQGLLVDVDVRAAFFEDKIPSEIASTRDFDHWFRQLPKPQRQGLYWQLDDLLVNERNDAAFPGRIELAGRQFDLDYRFEPGNEADGVTLVVPLAWLNAVPAARLDWLVPGLLPERVAALIRSLPKALRRNFVPAPDFARAFVEAEPPRDAPLLDVLMAWMRRTAGVEITHADFDPSQVPPHLHMRITVLDEQGRVLASGRDLAVLQARHGARARRAFAQRAAGDLARTGLSRFEPDELPERIENESGLVAFPAFIDRGTHVDLVVLETADTARLAHVGGIRRLLLLRLADPCRRLARQLPITAKAQFAWAAIDTLDRLRSDIVEHALVGLIPADLPAPRTRAHFERLADDIGERLGRAATERALRIEQALLELAETSPLLAPPLLGFAAANFEDLRNQLSTLFPPDLGRRIDDERLADYPRYLKAMRQRVQRLQQDPRKDQTRMLVAQGFEQRLQALADDPDAGREHEALFWLLQELRVSLFAQELGTRESVSEKRVEKRLHALE